MKNKPGKKWTFKHSAYQRLSEDDDICRDVNEDEHLGRSKKKEAKRLFVQASKRIKRATWSALKTVYRGFMYSSYQVAYTYGGMPGLDPQYFPHVAHVPYVPADILRYRQRY